MRTRRLSSSPRLLTALALAATIALAAPALAMEVTIGEVNNSIQTTGGGVLSGATIGLLVKKVKQALEEQAQDQVRRDQERRPQRPQ